jgi:hypothetical protein
MLNNEEIYFLPDSYSIEFNKIEGYFESFKLLINPFILFTKKNKQIKNINICGKVSFKKVPE